MGQWMRNSAEFGINRSVRAPHFTDAAASELKEPGCEDSNLIERIEIKVEFEHPGTT